MGVSIFEKPETFTYWTGTSITILDKTYIFTAWQTLHKHELEVEVSLRARMTTPLTSHFVKVEDFQISTEACIIFPWSHVVIRTISYTA